ncbi:MAG: hypothetical protein Tsb002_02170 [Wenzhouxiangellaceae bacterium]
MILDPQRNLPGVLLLGIAAVLGLILLAMPKILRNDFAAIEVSVEPDALPASPESGDTSLVATDYASKIMTNPIFFDDRTLPVDEVEETQAAEETTEDVAVSSLNATVTGVIITPESRLAVVSVEGSSRTQILREGMSLDGDLAAWRVGQIEPRKVNFSASDGQTAALELQVYGDSLQAPSSPPAALRRQPQAVADGDAANDSEKARMDRQASLAEEVRRRIAERRAQLRAQRQQQLEQQQMTEENE